VLLSFAALAYDTGVMLLERRDQQNAADASALAGARYLPGSHVTAESAARSLATANGFTDGVDSATVAVTFPTAGRIKVQIGSTRASIFGAVLGRVGWGVAASAVAANEDNVGAPFAMLALDPHGCDALFVSGNGQVLSNGNIQVNSDCLNWALRRQGGGDITVTASGAACNAVGGIRSGGGGDLNCAQNPGAPGVPDPLIGLPAPPHGGAPASIVQVTTTTKSVPDACPGGTTPSTEAAPETCQFPSSYAGTSWRLFPGYYPGGLQLQGGTFYFEPGIYFIAGGGLTIVGSGATAVSVDAGGTTLGGGILLYNSEDPAFTAECVAGTAPAQACLGAIDLAGSDASVDLWPLDIGATWDGIVIFQDRNLTLVGDEVIINGSSSDTQVRGTIYVPTGEVKVNGSGGTVTVDQVLAFRFMVNGSPGSQINVLYDSDFIFSFTAAGLIE
jgi:hypothetical protein